jgi:hypothetical protein
MHLGHHWRDAGGLPEGRRLPDRAAMPSWRSTTSRLSIGCTCERSTRSRAGKKKVLLERLVGQKTAFTKAVTQAACHPVRKFRYLPRHRLGFIHRFAVRLKDRFRQDGGGLLDWSDEAVQFGKVYSRHRDGDAQAGDQVAIRRHDVDRASNDSLHILLVGLGPAAAPGSPPEPSLMRRNPRWWFPYISSERALGTASRAPSRANGSCRSFPSTYSVGERPGLD